MKQTQYELEIINVLLQDSHRVGQAKGNLAIYAVYVWIVCFHVCNLYAHKQREGEGEQWR
jgi:hypothetical protein